MTGITGTAGPRPIGMVQAPIAPGRQPGMQAGGGVTVQDVLRVLKRWLWLMLAVFVLVMIATVVGTYIWATWYPSYRATAFIEVKTPNPPPTMSDRGVVANVDIIEQHMNTQAAIIRSLPTMIKALNSPIIKNSSWYKSFGKSVAGRAVGVDVEAVLTDMEKKRLRVLLVRDTRFVSVSFVWRDAKEAAEIANVVADTYYQDVRSASLLSIQEKLKEYKIRAEALSQALISKREEQKRFRAQHKIPVLRQTQTDVGEQVAVLHKLLAEVLTEKARIRAMYEQYHLSGAMAQMVETPEMRMRVEMDPKVRQLEFEQSSLVVSMDTLTQRYGTNHRSVRDLQMRMDALKAELNATRSRLSSDVFNDMRETTAAELDKINSQVLDLQNRLMERQEELADLETRVEEYLATERELEEQNERLKNLTDYLGLLSLKLKNPELVRVSIVSRAVRPIRRSSPNWLMNLSGGMVLGMLMAVGLAFLLEFTRSTVRLPVDIVRQMHMPLLGQIPAQDDDEASPADMNELLEKAPHSILAESFRQLRTNLMFSAPAERQRSILVTSCSPQEGKTCIAVNLATVLALAERKVLLVDANFRRPSLAEVFGIPQVEMGLSNILIGHDNPESLIHKTHYENLDILPAGPLPPNPAELLGGSGLRDFIEKFSSKYQTIMFDGPPLLVVSDTLMLATAVDGVVMVIRAGHSSRGAIQRAREQLRRVDAKLLGVVMNDVRIARGGYFREAYRAYYDYQMPAETTEMTETAETTKTAET